MNNVTPFSQATPESSWAEFQEMQRYLKELHADIALNSSALRRRSQFRSVRW
jgi:hypothetical protein